MADLEPPTRPFTGVSVHTDGLLRSVAIHLPHHFYVAITGPGLLSKLGTLIERSAGKDGIPRPPARCCLVYDHNLPAELVEEVSRSLALAGYTPHSAQLIATEEDKSLQAVEGLLDTLAQNRHERNEPLIALGGGIVGDVAGFAAAIYRRGVPVIQCPTTLLAMVDASVGGKTGVNLRVGESLKKNFVGSFHQPSMVLADVGVLHSLPKRVYIAGLAECIKHGMLAGSAGTDPQLFLWMEQNLDQVLARDPERLTQLIASNIAIKASVVVHDEREEADETTTNGGRALLNLGHTFGHAIETLPGLSPDGNPANAPLSHGEAVALGLVAATNCAIKLGIAPQATLDRLLRMLTAAGLPTKVAGLPPSETILAGMMHDKKVLANRLRLVLPFGDAGNQAKVVVDPPHEVVLQAIDSIRA